MYERVSDIRPVRYNLWHTFRGEEERQFLKSQFADIDVRDWLPAAADLQVRVVEPLFSLVKEKYLAARHRDTPLRISAGQVDPDPDAATTASNPTAEAVEQMMSDGLKTTDALAGAEVLRRVCHLADTYGFRVRLVWPPMAAQLDKALMESGALARLQEKMRSIMTGRCQAEKVFDFNKVRTYTASSFHLDMIHLFGDGWEQRYASDLRRYLSDLPDHSSSTDATQSPGATRLP